jgi:hypothetical protein
MHDTVNPVSDISGPAVPLTIKRQPGVPAAANGSNYIVLRCPQSPAINDLTCPDDLY